jgi:hypothetical protein
LTPAAAAAAALLPPLGTACGGARWRSSALLTKEAEVAPLEASALPPAVSDADPTDALTPAKVVELLDRYIVGQARTHGARGRAAQ